MACSFCELSPERNVVIEDGKLAYVMPSNPRLMKDHLLVVPKRHVANISELSVEERNEIWDLILKFQKILLDTYTGCDIRQHFRPFLKDSDVKVSHIHFHLLPRTFEDEYYTVCQINENKLWKFLSKKELEEIKNKF
jgi:diadenosine tetraphosphate (Ap4A) HIT family hydrolase